MEMKWVNEWDSRLEYVDEHWLYFDGQPLNGYMYDLWENGQMSYKETYFGGRPTGEAIYWNAEGQKTHETVWEGDTRVEKKWHDNGQLAAIRRTSPEGVSSQEHWDEAGKQLSA